MDVMSADHDQPVERLSGLSARRERMWGLIGGLTGAGFGLGSALIAVVVQGAPWSSGGLYPRFFSTPHLLFFDGFLLTALGAGLSFEALSLVSTRYGRYPRTDGFGAGLVGLVLSALSGSLIFLRLTAVIRGS